MVRGFASGATGSGFKTSCMQDFSKTQPTGNGYPGSHLSYIVAGTSSLFDSYFPHTVKGCGTAFASKVSDRLLVLDCVYQPVKALLGNLQKAME